MKTRIPQAAESFEKLVKNTRLRKEMGENGFISWKENFTWQKIVHQYEKYYLEICQET